MDGEFETATELHQYYRVPAALLRCGKFQGHEGASDVSLMHSILYALSV